MKNKIVQINISFSLFFFFFQFLNAKAPVLSQAQLTSSPPRIIRTCCSFGSELGLAGIPFVKYTDITQITNLGNHCYLGNKEEGNGIIYTKKGGFIDIGHLRDLADWTAFIYCHINDNQSKGTNTIIDLRNEGGIKKLIFKTHNDSNCVNPFDLASKIAYDLSLWHEIATWFGASYIPLIPERYSSFSPEDLYSNLLGTKIGIEAIKSNLDYNEAITKILNETLINLKAVQTYEETYEAMAQVQNIWWTRDKKLPNKKVLLKRFFDSKKYLYPWTIFEEEADSLFLIQKVNENISDHYQIRIEVNYKIPIKKIDPTRNNRIITQKDFGMLIDRIILELNAIEQKDTLKETIKKERKRKRERKRYTLREPNRKSHQFKRSHVYLSR